MSFMKSTTNKKTAFFEFFTKGILATSPHLANLPDDLPHIHNGTKGTNTLLQEIKKVFN